MDACVSYRIGGPRRSINADQTVIIIWDAAGEDAVLHPASVLSRAEADDFDFFVPSPTQPELEEVGDDAFPHLRAG